VLQNPFLYSEKALIHSNQGYQYTIKAYEKQVKGLKIQGSHYRRGNCHENACIEMFRLTLKDKEVVFSSP
jgi:transposase InsO family protein